MIVVISARQDDRRAVVQRVLNRRQRRADARIVADAAVFHRHVEVDPDEHALSFQVEVADGQFHKPFATSLRSRSTQRFE